MNGFLLSDEDEPRLENVLLNGARIYIEGVPSYVNEFVWGGGIPQAKLSKTKPNQILFHICEQSPVS